VVEPIRIRSVRKLAPQDSERAVSAEETLTRARCMARDLGVTRLADITGLDRIGIPVYTAVVPKSEDAISVYNGKGVRRIDSKTGALMEAIERQTALTANLPLVEASYRELRRGTRAVADPETFNHQLYGDYGEDRVYRWIEGYDLLWNEPVWVPAGLAGFGPACMGDHSPFTSNTSNGLASGNCLEEALCHALCELVERDAWTFAELRSQWIPWARREALSGETAGAQGYDDATAFPRIDLSGAGDPFSELVSKYTRAGLRPVVRDITSGLGICCAIATVADDSIPDFPQAHSGMGAHPNSRIAVVRALTELAQSRLVDIQAVREDLSPSGTVVPPEGRHLQRIACVDRRRWLLQESGPWRPLLEIHSVENDDIANDIRLILDRLASAGIERVIAVEFTAPGGFAVVRVLVPGLEFWAMDQGRVGPRATQFWRKHVQA
jgi:ribosomal protein S12 methylthiotransferase accessory factor YcaO